MSRASLFQAMGLLLLAAVSWGGMFQVAKPLLTEIDAFHMTAIRYGGAAILFAALLAIREGRAAFRMEGAAGLLWLYGSLGFAGFNLLAFTGLSHSRPEHAAVIMALMPLMTALVNWGMRGVRPASHTLFAIALALTGVVLVVTDGHLSALSAMGQVGGDLLLLLGALSWVFYTLGAARFAHWSPLRYTTLTCLLGVLSIFAATAAMTRLGHIHPPTAAALQDGLWALAYMVVIGAVIAVLSWNAGIRKLGALNGVLFINFVPVSAFVIGVALGHHFGGAELAGATLVILALVFNSLLSQRARSRVAGGMAVAR
jgi:drug/metabolite transporter (DMT)-like permease